MCLFNVVLNCCVYSVALLACFTILRIIILSYEEYVWRALSFEIQRGQSNVFSSRKGVKFLGRSGVRTLVLSGETLSGEKVVSLVFPLYSRKDEMTVLSLD